MNEWEFTGEVSSWINQILDRIAIPPFHRAKIEQSGSGSRKRRDLTLLDKSKRAIVTGEIKLPYKADGSSPYVWKVVQDAREKARKAKARFFFTWNVNECVLWETDPPDPSKLGQNYVAWAVTNVHNEAQLQHQATEEEIESWLIKFLHRVAQILVGTAQIGAKPPDEKFVEALESSLRMPIAFTFDELYARHSNRSERNKIERWMREDQGWTIRNDKEGIEENLERAARFACYALVNKLVFHEALLKRYGKRIDKIKVSSHTNTGEQLWTHLEAYFKDAIKITGDYETVFGEEHLSTGDRIPFFSDEAVPHWRTLIEEIHEFDFSRLDHEIIGTLFERLLSPEERHKFGQYYTKTEVADLINSFCIRRGDEKVMDPACGGGTFLVRAYARMKALMPLQPHGKILSNIFGVDVMNFATHLSTINLAIRDLIDEENYPQVVRSDFFDVHAEGVFVTLPKKAETAALGKTLRRKVSLPKLDAVIGNPPYIRQEEIPTGRTAHGRSPKDYYRDLVRKESGFRLSGRSDIHCYFWPHSASFLKSDGYLCFLTSSQWLDVEYGFKLQEWILKNFAIVAIIESINEPWFVGARVATAITILQRQVDESARQNNLVRFMQLRQPIDYLLPHDKSTVGAIVAANDFRDEIMALKTNTANLNYRARLVRQGDLWTQGVQLGTILHRSPDMNEDTEHAQNGAYYGGKWGVFLRAPDVWFDLLDNWPDGWVPLGEIAHLHRGVTSGRDDFFFPRDCSQDCLSQQTEPKEFEREFGVPRKLVQSDEVKLVKCGEDYGQLKAIESRYLQPEVHSLMEIDGFVALPENCSRMILLINEKRKAISGKYARQYIEWGEKQKIHKGSTCSARQTPDRGWYDLTGHECGAVFWPMTQKYKHAVPCNPHRLICNHNLFDLIPRDGNAELLAGILNSSWVVLSKFQFGRFAGTEGTLKTEVVDVGMMLVPDPRHSKAVARQAVEGAFAQLKTRKALQFLSERYLREAGLNQRGKSNELDALSNVSELDMEDRRTLDDAVLQMIGVKSFKKRRELIDELYSALGDIFERHRRIEEKANVNKRISKRRMRVSPQDIAAQIIQEIDRTDGWIKKTYGFDIIDRDQPYDVYDIPQEGTPRRSSDIFDGEGLVFVKGKSKIVGRVRTRNSAQEELVILLVGAGLRSLTRIPLEPSECQRAGKEFSTFIVAKDKRLTELVQERTSDPDTFEAVLASLKSMLPL
jgi:hypothetical protein